MNVSSDLALKMIPVLVIEGSTSLLEDFVNGRLLHLRRPVHVIHSDMSLINLDRYSLLLGDNWVLFLLRKLLLRPFALLSGSSCPSGCDRHLKLLLVILGCQLLRGCHLSPKWLSIFKLQLLLGIIFRSFH